MFFFLILFFFFRASLDFCSHDISARCVFHLSPGYNCDDVTVINPFTKFIAVFVYFMLFFKRLYMRRLHMDLEIFFFSVSPESHSYVKVIILFAIRERRKLCGYIHFFFSRFCVAGDMHRFFGAPGSQLCY